MLDTDVTRFQFVFCWMSSLPRSFVLREEPSPSITTKPIGSFSAPEYASVIVTSVAADDLSRNCGLFGHVSNFGQPPEEEGPRQAPRAERWDIARGEAAAR